MATWLLPTNIGDFDLDGIIRDRKSVDWLQKGHHYCVGDEVFFYLTAPEMKIKYRGTIVKTHITESDVNEDSEYWISRDAYYKGEGEWIRVVITAESNSNHLSLEELRKNGLTASPQGPSRLPDNIVEYINRYISTVDDFYPDSEGIGKTMVEGAVKQVTVNAYERNPVARAECIEHYKPICWICGFDFEKEYGSFASGFIHVHHKIPIHEIQGPYEVDPIKDLIPVCPNCHAMLHRKREDGKYYSVDELKDEVQKRKI